MSFTSSGRMPPHTYKIMVGLSTGLGLRTLTNKLIDESNLLKEILEPVTEKLPKSRFYKIFQAS